MSQHIALKCTYNNGDEGIFVGFNGTCSEDIIKSNIENGRDWCGNNECICKKYYDKGFKGKKPLFPCMESELFRDWKFGAGVNHGEIRHGPRHFTNVEKGKFAILTTIFPSNKEIDRNIIGFFKISKITGDIKNETQLYANKQIRCRLPIEDSKKLFFWDYYENTQKPNIVSWKQQLNRGLTDQQIFRMLYDIRLISKDEKIKQIIDEVLKTEFGKLLEEYASKRLELNGVRQKLKKENLIKRNAMGIKYGSTGEGPDHKRLKEWVSQHPDSINLSSVTKTIVEHSFLYTGDCADILFELPESKYVIVEIETTNPLPGCHQLLKYKTLKCAELDISTDSQNIEMILIAWNISADVRRFCHKYGIKFFERKV